MTHAADFSAIQITRRAFALLLCALLLAAAAPSAPAASEEAGRVVSVIVQSIRGSADAKAAVESAGGTVVHDLDIIQGVSATVDRDGLRALRASKALSVTPNAAVGFHKAFDGMKTAHQITKVTRASDLASEGIDGSGVTVALLDTGVYDHADLAGRVVHCEDFSHERDTEAHCADTFGHGTFMAGQIAGNGASSGGKYRGSAPAANIVSVKLAGFDGSTDVSTVLAGIQWAVAHKDVYGISVMSLSLGTDSAQDYRFSPLNFAVQKAWSEGITVVVSAGNDGPGAGSISKPGDDPFVITVGASNHEGSVSIGDDMVPVFSGRGPTRSNGFAKPDIVAPGVHTVSLRSPGSAIDQKFCSTACVGDSYFKGTGSSMSTAYVAGIAAQVLEANPGLNPNQVKHRLTSTARSIAELDKLAAGHGLVDAYAAAKSTSTAEANQGIESSSGLGLLQDARGSFGVEVVTPMGEATLTGEFSAQYDENAVDLLSNPLGLVAYDPISYTTTGWDPASWDATKWSATKWSATKWSATKWSATKWSATKWSGTEWDNPDWDATKWSGVDWDATKWSATKWSSKWYAAAWD